MFPFANPRSRRASSILRPQDVFAATLYTANSSPQTVVTSINADMHWLKSRAAANSHSIYDKLRGAGRRLASNLTDQEIANSDLTSFTSTGFTLANNDGNAATGGNAVAWSYRRAAKFFDVVTYTGDGGSARQIPHGLGVAPGMIIVKVRTASGYDWIVWHRSFTGTGYLVLDSSSAFSGFSGYIVGGNATTFTVDANDAVNLNGASILAYLFAHNPDTINGIIQCGGFTTDSSGLATVNLGWMPQYLETKRLNGDSDWRVFDAARGWGAASATFLRENTADAEQSVSGDFIHPTATGINVKAGYPQGTYIYRAIRAPM